MIQILEIDTNTPWWKQDLNMAIEKFRNEYGIEPRMIIGKNIRDALINEFNEFIVFDNYLVEGYEGMVGEIQGTPCEYDPNISCVILKA